VQFFLSKKYHAVSLSSTEEENGATDIASYEAVWSRRILVDLPVTHADPTTLHCNKLSVLKLAKNLVFL
jgi:hypothetical protein